MPEVRFVERADLHVFRPEFRSKFEESLPVRDRNGHNRIRACGPSVSAFRVVLEELSDSVTGLSDLLAGTQILSCDDV
jgi:hypothetical protein